MMQVYVPFARPAGQDQKYFPLGTSKAAPAREWVHRDPEKFRKALTKMLGSEKAADDYIAYQRVKGLI
jgi:hypothetical protein